MEAIFEDPVARSHWASLWDKQFAEEIPSAWDCQWHLTCLSEGGLTVMPTCNLVDNIGVKEGVSHDFAEAPFARNAGFTNIPADASGVYLAKHRCRRL